MSTGTGIEWTDATWNPVSGCTRVSAGCDHCYAVKQTHRLAAMGQEKYKGLTVLNPRGDRHFNGQVHLHHEAIGIPLKWRRGRRVFVNSMSDLFHEKVPFEFVDSVFAVMALCPQHTFQVLTKRPERMAKYLTRPNNRECLIADRMISENGDTAYLHLSVMKAGGARLARWPLPNVWLGTSVENQAAADERIPHLLKCPAAVRFLSCEPLLGAIDFAEHWYQWGCGGTHHGDGSPGCPRERHHHHDDRCRRPWDWVIVGGESGKGAREYCLSWGKRIIDQCRAARVPVFHKQFGSNAVDDLSWRGSSPAFRTFDHKGGDMAEWPEGLRVREMPGVRA